MSDREFDFHVAGEQEKRLAEITVRMEDAIKRSYGEVLENLHQGWQSDNRNILLQKMQILQEKTLKTVICIRHTEEALHHASARAKYAEERAEEIAENRTENI